MLHIPIEEFREEINMELICYDGMDERDIENFKQGLENWLASPRGIKARKNNQNIISLPDTDHLFSIAANYVMAVIENNTDLFWKEFLEP